jgi:hypothetical protein
MGGFLLFLGSFPLSGGREIEWTEEEEGRRAVGSSIPLEVGRPFGPCKARRFEGRRTAERLLHLEFWDFQKLEIYCMLGGKDWVRWTGCYST